MPYKDKEKRKSYHKQYHKNWYKKNIETRSKEIAEYNREYYPTPQGRYVQHKNSCKRRGLINELTLEQFTNLINSNCTYCGGEGHGVDRIDNSFGYLVDNCASCCAMCNYMKKNYSKIEFIEHCIKIAQLYQSIAR